MLSPKTGQPNQKAHFVASKSYVSQYMASYGEHVNRTEENSVGRLQREYAWNLKELDMAKVYNNEDSVNQEHDT